MAWPSGSRRARLVRRWRWHYKNLRAEIIPWFDQVAEIDRAQRDAFHTSVQDGAKRLKSFFWRDAG